MRPIERRKVKAAKRWLKAGGIAGVCPCGNVAGETCEDNLPGLPEPAFGMINLSGGEFQLGPEPPSYPEQTCLRHRTIEPHLLAEMIVSGRFIEHDPSKRERAAADAVASGNREGFAAKRPPIPDAFEK